MELTESAINPKVSSPSLRRYNTVPFFCTLLQISSIKSFSLCELSKFVERVKLDKMSMSKR